MNILLKTYRELTEQDYEQLWEKGLFVFDANVLLDLYRLPENARKDLLNILEERNFSKRIWIPFQVLLEFINNRLEAIGDQKNKFSAVKSIVNETIESINISYNELTKKLNKLELKKRHSVINTDSCINEELFKESYDKLTKFILELDNLEKNQPDVNDKDLLQKKVLKIFNNKIGKSFSSKDLEEIYKEGIDRYKDEIPPGYKDDDKEGFYLFEDKKFVRKYGDLVVWKEIINKANEENLEFIVLITGDTKEDWWQEKRGKKLGARYELLNEIYFKATSVQLFHIYDTSNFMKFAKQYLGIDIKDESIKETRDLLSYNEVTKRNSPAWFDKKSLDDGSLILPTIKSVASKFSPVIDVILYDSIKRDFRIKIPRSNFHAILIKIFIGITNLNSDQSVSVNLTEVSNNKFIDWEGIAISFETKNYLFNPSSDFNYRWKGIEEIESLLKNYNSFVSLNIDSENYELILFINKEFIDYKPIKKISGIRI